MAITGPQLVTTLREKLEVDVGRHLFGVLGTYARLVNLEQLVLPQALDPKGRRFPVPTNVNRELLARIGDQDLRSLVSGEARRPQTIKLRLNQELDGLLADLLRVRSFVILKQVELLFAYGLDLSVFRTRATNQSHILLLLPGERRADHIVLFHEADARFHRTLPQGLITDNHLWELTDG